jgi:hypothetical protein
MSSAIPLLASLSALWTMSAMPALTAMSALSESIRQLPSGVFSSDLSDEAT